MTREQVMQVLPLIQAFAEGKTIQTKNGSKWIDIDSDKNQLILDSVVTYQDCFRVKPKDTYRPFREAEDCWQEMLKHQPFGWVKFCGTYSAVVAVSNVDVSVVTVHGDVVVYPFVEVKKDHTFADGIPFGIKEER